MPDQTMAAVRKLRDECQHSACLLFIQSGIPAHAVVTSTSRVFPLQPILSGNVQKCTQRCISQRVLYPSLVDND